MTRPARPTIIPIISAVPMLLPDFEAVGFLDVGEADEIEGEVVVGTVPREAVESATAGSAQMYCV